MTIRATLLAVLYTASAAGYARADTPMAVNVPPGDLATAVESLAKQCGIYVIYPSEQLKGLTTRGVSGTFEPKQAFSKLIEGTPLVLKEVGSSLLISLPAAGPVDGRTSPASQPAPQRAPEGGGKPASHSSGDALHLAQATAAGATADASLEKGTEAASASQSKPLQLEEVVITGSHIRGELTSVSPVITYDRDALDRSGHLSTQDFIQSIPQAFGGGAYGASPDGMLGKSNNAAGNNEHASAVNLRGLGENATLVLVNGHRMAPSAYGNIVDISTIPLAGIDHIDVLTDGASAIYGADAVAGVVNIVLRRDFSGADTQVTYGGAAGGFRSAIVSQTFGARWDSGSIMGTYQFQHDTALPTSARAFTAEVPQPTNVLNPFTESSAVLNGEQRVGSHLSLYGDALLTWKRTIAQVAYGPGNSYDSYSDPNAINVHLGLRYAIIGSWVADLSGTYARQRTDVGFYYNNEGVLNDTPVYIYRARTPEIDFNISGTAAALPGGDLGVAIGASRRDERALYVTTYPNWQLTGVPPGNVVERHATAEYAEVHVPFVGEANSVPLVRQLTLSAAVRHDAYSDFGGTTDPKLGLLWSALPGLDLKVNWSRAFRPPSLGELNGNGPLPSQMYLYPFASPAGSGSVPILITAHSNPDLSAEKATTYDVAVELRPVPGLVLSLDYYNVDFTDRIEFPPFDTNALLHPGLYGSLIQSLPSDAAAAAYVANLQAQGYQFLDLPYYHTSTAGVRYVYPFTYMNAAVVRQNGVDFTGQYAFSVGADDFRVDANLAFINRIDTQFSPGATVDDLDNTYGNPLRFRSRVGGTWTRGAFDLSSALNFSNAYYNPYSSPAGPIGSFLTCDLSAALRLARDDASSPLHGTLIRLSALNLLDRYPPHAVRAGIGLSGVSYDVGNASPVGRVLSLQVQKKW